MFFKKTTEYTFRIMSFLASDPDRLYTTTDIFNSLNIPFRYLRKQMTVLTKTGLVESVQGKYGGYRLKRKRSKITLLDIVEALGDGIYKNDCFFGYKKCALTEHCLMHTKWVPVKEMINDILKSTTLDDIGEENFEDIIKTNSIL